MHELIQRMHNFLRGIRRLKILPLVYKKPLKTQVEADRAQEVLVAAKQSVLDSTASKDEAIKISKREMEITMAEVDKFQKEADDFRKESQTCLEAADTARATMYEQLAKAREDLAELSKNNAVLKTDAAAAIQKESVVRTEVALLQAERSAAVAKATVEAASAIHAQQEQAKADDEEDLDMDGPEFADFIHRGRASRLKNAQDEEDEEDDDDWEDDPGQRFGYSDQTEYDEDATAAQECPPRVVNFNMSTPPLHRYPQHPREEAADSHVGHGYFPRYAEQGRPMSPRALFGTSLFNHSVPTAPHHFVGQEPCTAQAKPDPLHPLHQAHAGAPAKPPTLTALHKPCYEAVPSGFVPGVFRTLPKVSLVTPPPPPSIPSVQSNRCYMPTPHDTVISCSHGAFDHGVVSAYDDGTFPPELGPLPALKDRKEGNEIILTAPPNKILAWRPWKLKLYEAVAACSGAPDHATWWLRRVEGEGRQFLDLQNSGALGTLDQKLAKALNSVITGTMSKKILNLQETLPNNGTFLKGRQIFWLLLKENSLSSHDRDLYDYRSLNDVRFKQHLDAFLQEWDSVLINLSTDPTPQQLEYLFLIQLENAAKNEEKLRVTLAIYEAKVHATGCKSYEDLRSSADRLVNERRYGIRRDNLASELNHKPGLPVNAAGTQRPCSFFAKGSCKDGPKCNFAHVPRSSSSKQYPKPQI